MDECPESERRRHARSALQPRAHLGHVFDHGPERAQDSGAGRGRGGKS